MKDEIVRIILEAKDKLSNVVRNAERNVNQSFGNIRKDLGRTDRDFEKFSNDFTRRLEKQDRATNTWANSLRNNLRKVQDSLKRTRSEFEKTNIAFGKVERDPETGRFSSTRQRQTQERSQSLLGQFRAGREDAAALEREIRTRLAFNKEELAEKKKALDRELHQRRENLIELAATDREALRRRISERGKALDAEILKLKQAQTDRQAVRDEELETEIRKRRKAFEDLRKKAEDDLREEIYQRKQLFYEEQFERKQRLKDDIAEVKRSNISAPEKDRLIDQLKYQESVINRAEQKRRDEDIRKLEIADDAIKRKDATARDIDIAEKEAAAAKIRRDDANAVEDEIRILRDGHRDINREDEASVSQQIRNARRALESEIRGRRANLTGQNEADLVRQFIEERRAIQATSNDTNALQRAFRSAGNAFGDFTRGIRRGRSDLREVDKLARQADTGFARFGQSIGNLTKNVGNLVNLRWYILISAIQVLGQLVLVLASNLVSLASSAALAASALGAGLVAAVGQAIPALGLLYAAFSRIGAAFTAAQQASKAGAQSSQDARAQAEAQTAAQQRLTDALYQQKQAVQQLADARRQARRDIVDSINAEIDANYALKDAEFAVLDAKQQLRDLEKQNQQDQQAVKDAQAAVQEAKERLAAAKKEGDQAEIQNAEQQLAIAKQNLADAQGQATSQKDRKRQIDEQKLAVKEAEQQLKEARIAQKRQEEDTARTVRLGVKGNQAVVDALHGVAQANREVANAQRGVTDATNKQASAGNLLQRQLSQLDPAERGLYKAFRSIQKTFKETFRPITDIIVRAVTGAVKRVQKVLTDPALDNAFRQLAQGFGKAITELTKHFTSKGFINSFVQLIHEANRNLPTLVKIVENLADAFLGLAKAGEPVVRDLLGRFAGLTGRFSRAINSPVPLRGSAADQSPQRAAQQGRETRGQKFIAGAKTYLDSWIKLANAIGRVFKYLFLDAAPTGNSLVVAMTRMFNNLADFLRDNPQKVKKFFDSMFTSLKEIASVLFPLVKVLLSAFTGSNAAAFTKFTTEVVLPGLTLMLQLVSEFAKLLLFLTQIPGLKFFLQLLVAEKALNRVFPATQRVTDGLKALGGWFFKTGEDGTRGFTKIRSAITRVVLYMRTSMIPAAKNMAKQIGVAAVNVGRAFASMAANAIKSLARVVYAMAVTVVNAAKQMAKALIETAIAGFRALVVFIAETVIPALVALGEAMWASLGPWGLIIGAVIAAIVLLDRKFHFLAPTIRFIGKVFKEVFDWIKDHWKLLVLIIAAPFAAIGYALYKFRHSIYNAFKDIIGWIKDHWQGLAQILIAIFLPGGIIIAAIWKWHDKIWDITKSVIKLIWKEFKRLPHLIIDALSSLPGLIIKLFKDVGKKIGQEIFSWIPKPLRGPLAKALGVGKDFFNYATDPVGDLKKGAGFIGDHLPATGGIIGESPIPRGQGPKGTDTVRAWLTPGEWVLNKSQQIKLAHMLRATTGQVAQNLFGANSSVANASKGGTGKNTRHPNHPKGKPKVHKGNHAFPYDLVSQQDQDGNTIWFVEALNGQFLELTAKDAAHMLRTAGRWIPKWIANHGFKLRKTGQAISGAQRYMSGGIVSPYKAPTFAMGGVVNSPQTTYGSTSSWSQGGNIHHKKIEQNFNVNTQGETDWNYVMRLAANHAQATY